MKLVEWVKGQVQKKEEEIELEPIIVKKVEPNYKIIDQYIIREDNSKVKIVSSPDLGEGLHYFVEEVELTPEQYDNYKKIVTILSK
jgi:hypothetical protein